jgi:hypothetical protein
MNSYKQQKSLTVKRLDAKSYVVLATSQRQRSFLTASLGVSTVPIFLWTKSSNSCLATATKSQKYSRLNFELRKKSNAGTKMSPYCLSLGFHVYKRIRCWSCKRAKALKLCTTSNWVSQISEPTNSNTSDYF